MFLQRAAPIAGKYWVLAAAGAQISDQVMYWLGLHLLGFVNDARIHCELLDLPVSVLTRTPKSSAALKRNLLGICTFIHPLRSGVGPELAPTPYVPPGQRPEPRCHLSAFAVPKSLFSSPRGFTHHHLLQHLAPTHRRHLPILS